ncbi:MAG: hypothetical protein ACOYEV_08765 [Candidatus Nanopelagicales bacterium]
MAKPRPQAPEVDPAYAMFSLEELRALRRELGDEESRVSYWRRIIQARIDLVASGNRNDDIVARLTAVLAESDVIYRRLANLAVHPAQYIAPLPDLPRLWTAEVDLEDDEAVTGYLAELRAAEAELSGVRREILDRLNEATDQLIARYHQDPILALNALPSTTLS